MAAQGVAMASRRGLWENPCEKAGVLGYWKVLITATQRHRWDLCKFAKTIARYLFGSQKFVGLCVFMKEARMFLRLMRSERV